MSCPVKSKCVAYLLWLTGGFWGLHHLYLGRDKQAIVWLTTAGGGIWGCFRDLWRIPEYVHQANQNFEHYLQEVMKDNKSPPLGVTRFLGSWFVAQVWGFVIAAAVPEEPIFNLELKPLATFLIPLGNAAGAYFVGCIGNRKGSFKVALLAAAVMVSNNSTSDQNTWGALFATIGFSYTRKWDTDPPKKRRFCTRVTAFLLCSLICTSLWSSTLYFNASVTDSNGETIKLRDAFHNFLRSPFFKKFMQTLHQIKNEADIHGWWHVYKDIIKALDPSGEHHAREVLGLPEKYTQEELRLTYKKLILKWHPDRHDTEEAKQNAQVQFLSIQEAYDTLSTLKSKRIKKS